MGRDSEFIDGWATGRMFLAQDHPYNGVFGQATAPMIGFVNNLIGGSVTVFQQVISAGRLRSCRGCASKQRRMLG